MKVLLELKWANREGGVVFEATVQGEEYGYSMSFKRWLALGCPAKLRITAEADS